MLVVEISHEERPFYLSWPANRREIDVMSDLIDYVTCVFPPSARAKDA